MIPRPISDFFKQHHAWLVPLLIFVVAFSMRLGYLNQLQSMPTFDYPIMDEKYHVRLAEQINSEEGIGDEPFYRAPLYPYLFAFLYKLFGLSLYWPRFIQVVFGSFVPLIVLTLGLKLFDRRIAYWAAGVTALYPTLIYFDASLLITSTMVLLVALLVYQLHRAQATGGLLGFAVCGLLLGLAGLARPNILLLGPALFIWIWFVIKPQIGLKKALIRYVVMGAMAFVVILPVTIRNYVVADDPVLISWQGGFNFFLGNNRQASGWSATVPGLDMTWEGGYNEAIAIAEQSSERKLKRSEVSDFWYNNTFIEINANRTGFVALMIRKLRLFFNGYEIPNNQDIYFVKNFAPILKPLLFSSVIWFPYGLIAPLALIGMAASLKRWREHLVLYLVLSSYVASLMLFFVCSRFRQPVMPILILFAVLGACQLLDLFKSKRFKDLALVGFVLAVLLVESNHDLTGLDPKHVEAESHVNLGLAYLEENRMSRAYKEFKQSIELDPEHAPAYNNLGIVTTRQGKLSEATTHFMIAKELEPNIPERYTNLANNYVDRGDAASAVLIMEDAVEFFPRHQATAMRLGVAYLDTGRFDEAIETVRSILRTDPQNQQIRQLLVEIANIKRDREKSENDPADQ